MVDTYVFLFMCVSRGGANSQISVADADFFALFKYSDFWCYFSNSEFSA